MSRTGQIGRMGRALLTSRFPLAKERKGDVGSAHLHFAGLSNPRG